MLYVVRGKAVEEKESSCDCLKKISWIIRWDKRKECTCAARWSDAQSSSFRGLIRIRGCSLALLLLSKIMSNRSLILLIGQPWYHRGRRRRWGRIPICFIIFFFVSDYCSRPTLVRVTDGGKRWLREGRRSADLVNHVIVVECCKCTNLAKLASVRTRIRAFTLSKNRLTL